MDGNVSEVRLLPEVPAIEVERGGSEMSEVREETSVGGVHEDRWAGLPVLVMDRGELARLPRQDGCTPCDGAVGGAVGQDLEAKRFLNSFSPLGEGGRRPDEGCVPRLPKQETLKVSGKFGIRRRSSHSRIIPRRRP